MSSRGQKNCTAYREPGLYKGKGRRPVHGPSVHLQDLFVTHSQSFQNARLQIYGAARDVRSLPRTYLWGQGLYQPLQSVLVEYGQTQAIPACTDLSMDAENIIGAYACCFKIEAMSREMEQQLGGLCYHFWTHAVPKLSVFENHQSNQTRMQAIKVTA